MYCRKCYTNLEHASDTRHCPKCHRHFDPATPNTFLLHPFPSRSKIIFRILATTILGIIFAFLVAYFQMIIAIPPLTSGH